MTPLSSLIQTLLSVPESQRFMQYCVALLADCTAGREFHPAPKTQTVYTRSGRMSIARREFPAGKFAHPASASRSPPGRTRPLRRLCRPQRSPERGRLRANSRLSTAAALRNVLCPVGGTQDTSAPREPRLRRGSAPPKAARRKLACVRCSRAIRAAPHSFAVAYLAAIPLAKIFQLFSKTP